MKTKTLLLAGMVCAASAVTSMAQVYSLNAVGFVNVTCTPGFNLIANPLNVDGTNSLNTIMPSVPVGCQVFIFNAGTGNYQSAQFLPGLGWNPSTLSSAPGQGFFFKNTAATNVVLTFTGSIQQGALTTPLVAGFQIVSSQVPQSGLVSTDLLFPPATSDQIYLYNGTSYSSYQVVAVNPTLWTGASGFGVEPTVAIGQSFFVKKAANISWTRTFSVNN